MRAAAATIDIRILYSRLSVIEANMSAIISITLVMDIPNPVNTYNAILIKTAISFVISFLRLVLIGIDSRKNDIMEINIPA